MDYYIQTLLSLNESRAFSETYEENGYESSTFFVELGLVFFVIVFSVIFFLVKMGCRRATQRCGTNCLTRRLRKPQNTSVVIVRFLIEGCNQLGLVALITISMSDNKRLEFVSDTIDIIFAYICIIFLTLAPFYLLYIGRRLVYKTLGLTDEQRNSIGALFQQYK